MPENREDVQIKFTSFINKLTEKTKRRFLIYLLTKHKLMKETNSSLDKKLRSRGLAKSGNKKKKVERLLSGKKNVTTKQLKNEEQQINHFKESCHERGLRCVEEWGTGARNRKENTTADITVTVVDPFKLRSFLPGCEYEMDEKLNISFKTKGGDFTQGNYGTGKNSIFIKSLVITEEDLKKVEEANANAKKIKAEIMEEKKVKRWNQLDKKYELENRDRIKKEYMSLFKYFFLDSVHKDERIRKLYDFENARRSELKCVGNTLSLSKKHVIPITGAEVRLHNSGSIIVGEFEIRAKAEGGNIATSWKMNLGLFK